MIRRYTCKFDVRSFVADIKQTTAKTLLQCLRCPHCSGHLFSRLSTPCHIGVAKWTERNNSIRAMFRCVNPLRVVMVILDKGISTNYAPKTITLANYTFYGLGYCSAQTMFVDRLHCSVLKI